MPAPYISVRLHKGMTERALKAAVNFIANGLGFPVVNDEVLIPAFLKHGRALSDANDYVCSCCYENTIPGRESFNPSASWINAPMVLELLLNNGKQLLTGETLCGEIPPFTCETFEDLLEAYLSLMKKILLDDIGALNRADHFLMENRANPLMSIFIEDCIANGKDIFEGGARYNLTGIIVVGVPNLINSLNAIREVVYEQRKVDLRTLTEALRADFEGYGDLRQSLLKAPKWGNGDEKMGRLTKYVTDALYDTVKAEKNARGGRFQLALYSFLVNARMGSNTGASPDGRKARQILTRNMNPTWGTDKNGPTEVFHTLSNIDFTKFPNGSALDLKFDPAPLASQKGRDLFGGFLMSMIELRVMQVQLSFVDSDTLFDAREHPEKYPDLMVKVAGFSARFAELGDDEKDEIFGRSLQRLN